MKDVERLAIRWGPEVILLRVRERRGVFMGFERWKLDRMGIVVGSRAAPRAPNTVVRSIFVTVEGDVRWVEEVKRVFCSGANTSSPRARK